MNKRIVLLLMLPMLTFYSRGQVQETYLKGIARADQGKFQEALEYFEKALSYDNDNSDYLFRIAEMHYKTGNSPAALEYLQRVEKEVPGKGSYLQARIYASRGNAPEAVKALESHLRSSDKLPRHIILLEQDFYGIENSPEWTNLWKHKWYSEEEELLREIQYLNTSGEDLKALEMIDAEIEARDGQAVLHALRGDILLGMKQYQGALYSYSRAIELNREEPDFYTGRAEAYLAQGKPEKAVSDLEKVLRLSPENLDLLTEIGRLYHITGDYAKASSYLNRALEYYPENPESLYLLGQVHFDSKKYLDALVQFNACLKISSSDPRFYVARGKTYLATKTFKYAENDLGMALDLDPGDPEVWYMKGLARLNLNDRDGAFSDWKQAARLGSYEAASKLEEYDEK